MSAALRRQIEQSPPGTLFSREGLLEVWDQAETDYMRELSTTEASREFGHSADWWRRAAPAIPGARQEADGGPWTLPLRSCREHLARLSETGQLRRRDGTKAGFGRRPWKGRTAPQIVAGA